jgi:hypothetical protein
MDDAQREEDIVFGGGDTMLDYEGEISLGMNGNGSIGKKSALS